MTLLEPLASALGIGVETLLTGQDAAAPLREPESSALRSVLVISGEERRQRRRRMTRYAVLVAVLVLAVVLLAVMQHNGRLLVRQRSVSPDGAMTLTVYRTSLLGGGFAVESSCPLPWTEYCQHCGQGSVRMTTTRQLDHSVTAVEELQWSPDGRYLLLCGATDSANTPAYIGMWDLSASDEDGAVQERRVDVEILVQLAGYSDPEAPEAALLPNLPGVSKHRWLPNVTLSGTHWVGSGKLAAEYAYDGTNGQHHTGTLTYDVTAKSVQVLRQNDV